VALGRRNWARQPVMATCACREDGSRRELHRWSAAAGRSGGVGVPPSSTGIIGVGCRFRVPESLQRLQALGSQEWSTERGGQLTKGSGFGAVGRERWGG
jgi:hypothetical protein